MSEHEKLKETAHLLIKSNHQYQELGLLTGKMGKVLFFFLYHQYTSKNLYKEFAEALLDDICEEIDKELYFDYRRGICGIGWGIDYLTHKQLISIDSNDIFETFDDTLFNHFKGIINTGYCSHKDIALYAISRYSHDNVELLPAHKPAFIMDIINTLDAHDAELIGNKLRLIYEGAKYQCNHHFFLTNEIHCEHKLNPISEGLQLLLNNISTHG